MKTVQRNRGSRSVLLAFGLVVVCSAAGYGLVRLLRTDAVTPPVKQQAQDLERGRFVEGNTDYRAYEDAMTTAVGGLDQLSREAVPTTEKDTEPQGQVDEEWAAYPRTEGFIEEVVRDLAVKDHRRLYRNKELNPQDIYIPVERRRAIEAAVGLYAKKLDELQSLTTHVGMTEFETLTRSGKASSVDLDEYRSKLTEKERANHDQLVEKTQEHKRKLLKDRGMSEAQIEAALESSKPVAFMPNRLFRPGVFASRVEGGRLLSATLDELPKTNESVIVRKQVVLDLVSKIAEHFVSAGCLDRPRRDALVEACAESLFE